MSYSEEAIAFRTIPPSQQIRLEDRLSFAYLEYCSIRQDQTGVVAYSKSNDKSIVQRVQIPVGALAVLYLGPGTSISQAAVTSITRSGCSVVFSGGRGLPAYARATSLTSSARWAIAQARLAANEAHQRQAAIILYKKQLGIENMPGGSIAAMRGLEGKTIRKLYSQLAKQYKVSSFRRDSADTDAVNAGLNLANSILYGCAASVCAALGINPALGVIHRGDARSLLFDLADLYKPSISMPLAFSTSKAEDPATELRSKMRSALVHENVLEEMLNIEMQVLTPYLPTRDDDRLIGGRNNEVVGHKSYGVSEGVD